MEIKYKAADGSYAYAGEVNGDVILRGQGTWWTAVEQGIWAFGNDDVHTLWRMRVDPEYREGEQDPMTLDAAAAIINQTLQSILGAA